MTGGDVDGEPYDTRVNLRGVIHTGSVFATDTLSLGNAWHITLSGVTTGRQLIMVIVLRQVADRVRLTAITRSNRFNPAAGVTFQPYSLPEYVFELQRR